MMIVNDARRGYRTLPRDYQTSPSIRHYRASEHLSNEQTHVAYMWTAILLVGLGVVVHCAGIYLTDHDQVTLPRRTLAILSGAKHLGLGMVLYGLLVMAFALRRYHRVSRAIERMDYRPDRVMVEALTMTALGASVVGIVWMLMR
jgi:putative membrane protein